MARYIVVTRQVQRPGRGKNGYQPAEVRVLDQTQSEWHAVRGLNDGIKFRREVTNTKYRGPRSGYGQALREAQAVADRLNTETAVEAN